MAEFCPSKAETWVQIPAGAFNNFKYILILNLIMRNVIIFEAHSDDSAVGVGGTIIKLVKEGYEIIKVIFAAGQMSHPHYKEEIIIKRRINETEGVGRQFGIKQHIFFGLKDGRIKEEIIKKDVYEKINRIIKKYHPVKIFTTSASDPHPDHRAVNKAVVKVVENMNYKGEVYSYEVWNIINVNETKPIVYNDISQYFKAKIAMMKSFKSQWPSMYPLLIPVYLRAKYYGIKNKFKYAEKLYRLR